MADNKKEPTFEFQNWFDGGDIFYRSVDKQRFQHALDAIVDDELGLAVIGTNETVLDHYCRMLVARLRDLNVFQVEVFLPTNTDSLLKRFNEMLASMSLERARQAPDNSTPVKLLVVNDAKSVDEEQWSLLVRLLADFPGVNVRLILFLDKTGWPSHEKPLGLFGRRLYRWVVETPTLDEAGELMVAAKQHGFERETEILLLHAGLGAAVRGGYSDEDPNEYNPSSQPAVDENDYLGEDYSDSNPFSETPVDFLDDEDPSYDENDTEKGLAGRNLWPVLGIFIISLAVTWVVVSKLNPDATDQYQSTVTGALNDLADTSNGAQISEPLVLPLDAGGPKINRNEKESNKPAAASQIAEAQAVVAALKKDKRSEQLADQAAEQKASALKQTAARQKAIADKKAAAIKSATALREAQALKEATALKKATALKEATALRKAAALKKAKSLGPIQGAEATDFFVQHIVLTTREQAKLYIRGYAGLRNATIVPIATGNSIAYAVLSGPFSARDRATEFTKGAGLPADYWIRAAGQLKAVVRD
ncbi:hypothetical protein N9J88_02950 [Porticoccaceae bacterium]|nr:hypothetical protein [Porticoccaceae bacterium]